MNLLSTSVENSLRKAKASLEGEMGKMKEAQENSLNIFKKTVADLTGQNEQLLAKRSLAITMAEDMTDLAASAQSQIGENTKVIDKITEFLD